MSIISLRMRSCDARTIAVLHRYTYASRAMCVSSLIISLETKPAIASPPDLHVARPIAFCQHQGGTEMNRIFKTTGYLGNRCEQSARVLRNRNFLSG